MSGPPPGLSVREAAEELGVSPSAVRQLIAQGQVRASKFAGRLVVDPDHLRQASAVGRPPGRPFSPVAAWVLLGLLAGQKPTSVSPSRLSQLRRHLRSDDPQELVGRLRKRADLAFWYVHPSLLGELAAEPRCVLGGRSAGELVGADLAGHSDLLEVYLSPAAADQLAHDYVADLDVSVGVANVVVRQVEAGRVPEHEPRVAAAPVVALDLIETGEARVIGAGWSLWLQRLDAWRKDDAHGC
ncbi:MAG: helix-turn-helix domain-containing protein [Nitriliruptor sp.]|uniref:helix-turn-helix domain-containing protein n=1 Tax=Nitriliruptor sp. TaxID=2448056 RepID=UPI0034A0648B